jgi:pyruvate formate-lyase/glycerol dehydratase family glycyl radical enzyme
MTKILMKEIKDDPDLKAYTLEKNLPLLKKLKDRYRDTKPAVCIERARYITEYMKSPNGRDETMELRRARAVNRYLTGREAIFHDGNLLAAGSTSKEIGAPVFPELLTGLSIWPELDSIGARKKNPLQLSKKEATELNLEIFPYWMDKTILESTRKKLIEENSETLEALKLQDRLAFFIAAKAGCISHTTPYYEKVLAKGLNAMMEEARQKANSLKDSEREKKEFYQAMQISMQGIINYANSLSRKAADLALQASSAEEKKHFRDIADICARVPANPADTFREAINSLWLCHVGVLAENINMAMNPGRLDQVFYPYFKKDVKQGKITIEEALTLIGCLWFKIADNTNLVPEASEKMFGGAGSVPAVTLGGVDKKGKDAVNDLTYLMLRVTELLKIKDPNVNARYHAKENKKEYLDRVCRVIIDTKAIPALYNDISNIAVLKKQGVKAAHARDYAVIGCVELGSAGREYSASSSILLNLTAAMDMTLYEGKRPYITGEEWQVGPSIKLEELKTFADFFNAFESQLKVLVEKAIAFNEELGRMHQKLLPTPLLSCFFEGPWEKGQDLIFGGALYNSSGATHVGFADVCDSLNAVEDAVYLKKKVTLQQMKEAVEKNFEGYDDLYAYIKNKTPKYGMDDSKEKPAIAVKNSKRLIKFLYDLYQQHVNYRGGKYRPAYWTMTNHAGLGTLGQALPNGRKKGEVFSSGITPASQCARDLTGAYLSVAKLDSEYIPGGYALNMKYSPKPPGVNGKYLGDFTGMIAGYFKAGGMQVQYNIRDYKDFVNAQKNPKEYPDLIVRVSGYSAYFKDLNPYMQRELITRTQYDLNTGEAVPLTVTIPDEAEIKAKVQSKGGE